MAIRSRVTPESIAVSLTIFRLKLRIESFLIRLLSCPGNRMSRLAFSIVPLRNVNSLDELANRGERKQVRRTGT
jgi:hypothetical protein